MRAAGGGGGGGLRSLLFLLVIPLVALVVLQLQPDQSPSASPTPTGSRSRAGLAPSVGRMPSVTELGRAPFGISGDWDLFASGDGVVVRIEFARDRLTSTVVPSLDGSGPVAFAATSTGALVRPLHSVPGYLVPDGLPARKLTGVLSTGDPVVPGPDPGHVWVDLGNGVDDSAIALVAPDGRPVGPEIGKPANGAGWIGPDGGGYPLLQTTGGIYDLLPAGPRRITVGALLASGPTGWLVVECDDHDRCAGSVVDRESRRHRPLPDLPASLNDAEGVVSPDGAMAALVDVGADGRSRLWLSDLRSGASSEVGVHARLSIDAGQNAIAWSPDSRWVFLVDDRRELLAVDTATEDVHHLGIDLPRLNQVVVRPSV